jgi:hypothetical protein
MSVPGLVELPAAEGYGLIVGRLRPGPPADMDAYLGPGLADELAMLGVPGATAGRVRRSVALS